MSAKQELNELVKEKESNSKVVDKNLSDSHSSDKKRTRQKARDWSSLNPEEYQ